MENASPSANANRPAAQSIPAAAPAVSDAGRKMDPTKRRRALTLALVVALPLAAYFVYNELTWVTTDNSQIQAHTSMIAPKVSGLITQVNVIENQKVKEGDVLAEIQPSDYENALATAEAEMASVQVRAADTERSFNRLAQLYKSGGIARQQYDTAEATYREATRRLQAAKSQVQQAQLNLSYTKIRAPQDGTVARRAAEPGMLASPQQPLFGFVGGKERWVVANFKETELRSIQIGAHADVEIDAITRKKFRGEVESISPSTGASFALIPPDNATGNFTKVVQRVPVRIKLTNLTPEDIDMLRAGLSAEVSVRAH